MPKENPTDQDIGQADHQCPKMVRFTDRPIDRLGSRSITAQEARRLSVCVIGWVSEVRQIALKEEGIDLKGHARRLKGKVPCLGKTDNYADGSC